MLTPTTITTNAGSIGSGQSASNLATQDQSGTQDTWNKYVEFDGAYSGYLTYAVTSGVTASSVTAIQAKVNYRGPDSGTQSWTFKLKNWTTSTWTTIGSNASASDWGPWALFTFTAGGTLADYISAGGAMQLQLVAGNSNDAANIDYAALVLTHGSSSDTTAPSAPTNLTVTGVTTSSASLSWSASTDNVGVVGYDVYQGGGSTPATSVTGTTATITGLTPSTTYTFTVKARDAATNTSAASSTATATTPAAPAGGTSGTLTPTGLTTTAGQIGSGQTAANLVVQDQSGTQDTWAKYVEFIGAYTGYLSYSLPGSVSPPSVTAIQAKINYRGPDAATQTWTFKLKNWTAGTWSTIGSTAAASDWGPWTVFTFSASGPLTDYISATGGLQLQLVASNGSDNADIDYAAIVVTAPDTAAPSAPADLAVTAATTSTVSLSWSASTDNVGVVGYDIYADAEATPETTTTATSATVTGFAAATTIVFTVRAKDAAGNVSAASTGVHGTTQPTIALPAPASCPGCWHPGLVTSWNWVLDPVPVAPYRDVAVYDIDGLAAQATDVAALHAAGTKAVCYLSVGSREDWRDDAAQFPAAIVGSPLAGWEDEKWLDVRDVQQSNSALAAIMRARLDACQAKGFDAVEFDNIDAFINVTGFPLTASDQAYYNAWLANEAHARGLSTVLKNDLTQITLLLPYFDMALNEECDANGECGVYDQFVDLGKPVFIADYSSSPTFCAASNAANLNGLQLSVSLDDSVFQPCR